MTSLIPSYDVTTPYYYVTIPYYDVTTPYYDVTIQISTSRTEFFFFVYYAITVLKYY